MVDESLRRGEWSHSRNAPQPPRRGVRGVGELVAEVAQTLSAEFAACSVRGEISGFSRAASGHCYFALKDADGQPAMLKCAMFRRAAQLADFAPRDGQLVEVRGRVGVYEARGELQFVVEAIQQAGAGALFERFLRLRASLEAQGLFDPERKRRLPPYPRRVGVVTSLGGAALHDVLTALTRRSRHVEVVVYPSLVQGADAPDSLCAAILAAGRRAEVDALIICRGGGSLEDLWAFNDERVVRALVASPIPTIVGVGHETDVTLADLAADLRAATPTAAAELVAPMTDESVAALMAFAQLMRDRVWRRLDAQAQSLDRDAARLARPGQVVHRHARALWALATRMRNHRALANDRLRQDRLQERLQRALIASVADHGHRLRGLATELRALDPAAILQRGYAWVTDESGRAVTSTRSLPPGARFDAVLADGSVRAVVIDRDDTI